MKYIQPIWYYRLAFKSSAPLLLDIDKAGFDDSSLVTIDFLYSQVLSRRMDAAYQALISGVIPNSSNCIPGAEIFEVKNIGDNYRFIRKYFATHWYFYILLIRLLSFNNPVVEVYYFLLSVNVKRFSKINHVIRDIKRNHGFNLIDNKPFVSIVIPTLNRYTYLSDVLVDLEKQDYSHFEVLICDQSDPFLEDFYKPWKLDIKLIRQQEKALWLARNSCIRQAKGDLILFFDDDSRVEYDWIRKHLECLEQFNAFVSAGVTDTVIGHGLSSKESYYHLSDVFDTGNSMVKREVFEKVGLFDRQFEKQRMGDCEFGLRAILGGYQLISNPFAKRIHLKVDVGGLRQMGSWDAFRPRSLFAPRPVPSVLYLVRRYFGDGAAVYYLMQNIPFSFIPYRFKKNTVIKLIFVFLFPLLIPLYFIVMIRSWLYASEKLCEGHLIEN